MLERARSAAPPPTSSKNWRAAREYHTRSALRGAKELIDRLNAHTADIGFSRGRLIVRRIDDFSGPYLLMGTTYLVPAASPIRTAADADRSGVKIGAVEGNSPTIYLQQHLKNAKVILWAAAPPFEEILKMFASGQVDAYAGNRARLVEAADRYSGFRVAQDNFTMLEQNIVVQKGDATKLRIVNDFLDEARASTFLRDSLIRAKLGGVEAPPAKTR